MSGHCYRHRYRRLLQYGLNSQFCNLALEKSFNIFKIKYSLASVISPFRKRWTRTGGLRRATPASLPSIHPKTSSFVAASVRTHNCDYNDFKLYTFEKGELSLGAKGLNLPSIDQKGSSINAAGFLVHTCDLNDLSRTFPDWSLSKQQMRTLNVT